MKTRKGNKTKKLKLNTSKELVYIRFSQVKLPYQGG